MQIEIFGVKYDIEVVKELLDDEKKELIRLEKALNKAKSAKQASQLNLKCLETSRTIDYLESALKI